MKKSIEKLSSIYMRKFPNLLIPFTSSQGKKLFHQALAENNMDSYFALSEQFTTQSEPEYCGPGTLVTILNTLKIDPKKQWKGIWRWYSEENLHCTTPELLKLGLCLEEFSVLARCNGAFVQTFRPIENLHKGEDFGIIEKQQKFLSKLNKPIYDPLFSKAIQHQPSQNAYCCNTNSIKIKSSSYETFRIACLACSRHSTMLLAVNSMRQFLQQTGIGHYSPVCAYNPKTNHSLLLDIARYKYPAYWLDTKYLYNSLIPLDYDTRRKRGFAILSRGVKTGKQTPLCKGLYDVVGMRKMQEYYKGIIENKHIVGKINLSQFIDEIILAKNAPPNILDELLSILFTFSHDFEKRYSDHCDCENSAKLYIEKIKSDLLNFNEIGKKFTNKEIASKSKILNLLNEISEKNAKIIFTIFILSFPQEIFEKLNIENKETFNKIRISEIKKKSLNLYNEIILMREMLGILGEKYTQNGFYDSNYIRENHNKN